MYYSTTKIDEIIVILRGRCEREGKHLIKTDTIFQMYKFAINLEDEDPERKRLLENGAKQDIQTRLSVAGYCSVSIGYFVNVKSCTNIDYLNAVIASTEATIKARTAALEQRKKIRKDNLKGQSEIQFDDLGNIIGFEPKPEKELELELEADSI